MIGSEEIQIIYDAKGTKKVPVLRDLLGTQVLGTAAISIFGSPSSRIAGFCYIRRLLC